MLAERCGYPGKSPSMESTAYTLYQDGPGGRDLVLEVWPVVSITSITDDTTGDFTDASYLVSSGDYTRLDDEHGLVRLLTTATHGAWSTTRGAIKAVYTAGYGTTPKKLKRLCALQVRHLYDCRLNQGKANVSVQGHGETYLDPTALAPEVEQGIGKYILPRAMA